jgi:hypothetical protein
LRQCRRWHYREISRRDIGRAGAARAPCSCFMCGNLRRNFKGEDALTIQERKAALMEKYDF